MPTKSIPSMLTCFLEMGLRLLIERYYCGFRWIVDGWSVPFVWLVLFVLIFIPNPTFDLVIGLIC